MRDPARLHSFYRRLQEVHLQISPDWRFAQLMVNFFAWIEDEKHVHPYFLEDEKLLSFLQEYARHTAGRP